MRRAWAAKLTSLVLTAVMVAGGFGALAFGHSHSSFDQDGDGIAAHEHSHDHPNVADTRDEPVLLAGSTFHLHGVWFGFALTISGTGSAIPSTGGPGCFGPGDPSLSAEPSRDFALFKSHQERIAWCDAFANDRREGRVTGLAAAFSRPGVPLRSSDYLEQSPVIRC